MCARSFIIANIHSSLGLCRLRCSAGTTTTMVTEITINRRDGKRKRTSPVNIQPETPQPAPPDVASPSSSSPNSNSTKSRRKFVHRHSNHGSTQRNIQKDFNRDDEIANTPEATLLKRLQQLSADMMKPSNVGCLEKTAEAVSDLFGTTSSYPNFTDAWKKAASGVMWLQEGRRLVTEAENLLLYPPPPPPTNANSSAPQH